MKNVTLKDMGATKWNSCLQWRTIPIIWSDTKNKKYLYLDFYVRPRPGSRIIDSILVYWSDLASSDRSELPGLDRSEHHKFGSIQICYFWPFRTSKVRTGSTDQLQESCYAHSAQLQKCVEPALLKLTLSILFFNLLCCFCLALTTLWHHYAYKQS